MLDETEAEPTLPSDHLTVRLIEIDLSERQERPMQVDIAALISVADLVVDPDGIRELIGVIVPDLAPLGV